MNAGYFISSILVNIQSVASQFMVENTQSIVVTVHHTASIQCHLLLVILSVFSFNIIAAKTTHIVIVTHLSHLQLLAKHTIGPFQ